MLFEENFNKGFLEIGMPMNVQVCYPEKKYLFLIEI
jgi:hypothetical protein